MSFIQRLQNAAVKGDKHAGTKKPDKLLVRLSLIVGPIRWSEGKPCTGIGCRLNFQPGQASLGPGNDLAPTVVED